MNTALTEHWQAVYQGKSPMQTSWFADHLHESLQDFDALRLPTHAALIDIGAGRSNLVDDWLDRGFESVTALDLSAEALSQSQARLGARAARVQWRVGDVCTEDLPHHHFDLWHDRAVFHFLTEATAQKAYVAQASQSLRGGAWMLLSCFADDGPQQCSGLPVARHSPIGLNNIFHADFELIQTRRSVHQTPFQTTQNFIHAVFKRRASI